MAIKDGKYELRNKDGLPFSFPSGVDTPNALQITEEGIMINGIPATAEQKVAMRVGLEVENTGSATPEQLNVAIATAEAARDAAFFNANVYASIAAGLAAVADTVQFQVVTADGLSIQRYRRDSAVLATAVGVSYPSVEFINSRMEAFFALNPDVLYAIVDSAKRQIAYWDVAGVLHTKYPGYTPSEFEAITGDLEVKTDSGGRILYRIDSAGFFHAKMPSQESVEVTASRGSRTMLADRIGQSLDAYGLPKRHVFGEWYLRETRQRLRKRLLAETCQYTIALIGDSWTHNVARYSGPTATTLKAIYGDAGPGWTGFAWGFGGASEIGSGLNGCISNEVSVTLSTNWLVHYASSNSPDICDIYSSAAGAKITVGFTGTGNTSTVKLHYIAGAGVIRYRWNAGTWTSLDTSVGSGLTVATMASMPTGTWSLEIENVSGTTTLCGVDVQKTADGVRVHKLGATGSSALSWNDVNAAQWQTALASLAPDLVVIMHGTNDQSNAPTPAAFGTRIQTIITRVRAARPMADILVVMPCENGRTNSVSMASYAEAAYQVAVTNKCAYLDLQYLFGDSFSEYANGSARPWFNADTIHPEPLTGGRVIVDGIIRLLTQI